MQATEVRDYFSLLRELSQTLEQLTKIEQNKIDAVRQDDLNQLNDCMKQEQVLSLSLRGLEQKRQAVLSGWKLDGLPLSALVNHVPEAQRLEAKVVAEELLQRYTLFQGIFEITQNTLECNLHQIELQLAGLGANGTPSIGYGEAPPELPSKMRTDFRA